MSLLKTKTEIIDGYEVTGTQLPAIQAWKLKAKLLNAIGPALNNSNSNLIDAELNETIIISAIGALAESIDPDKFINLVLEMLHGVYVSGNDLTQKMHIGDREVFNMYMAGKMMLIYKILYFVLKLNFEDFFLKLQQNIGNLGSGFPMKGN